MKAVSCFVKKLNIRSFNPQFSAIIAKFIPEIPDLFPYLAILSLTYQSLTVLSSNFCKLTELQSLHLKGDDISEIPSYLFHQMLDLVHLRLELPSMQQLPSFKSSMGKLKHLILRNLPLVSEISSFFEFTPKLEELLFLIVAIQTLPLSFFELNTLNTLKILCCSHFSHFPEINLADAPLRENLIFLYLNWVEVVECPILQHLPDYLFYSPNLEVFNCLRCSTLQILPHQYSIASHLIGFTVHQCGTVNANHYNPPKKHLIFLKINLFLNYL
ncbi:hypothetical protein [Candidatus Lokiarchaeum ossiferum]|uniref:hypothetical protein n=1 Tax=Candidatus Lokiarchaeum ossiferum TaxID=2951803 RepID=UPI00352E4CFA